MKQIIKKILNEQFSKSVKDIFDDHYGLLNVEPGFFYDESYLDSKGFPRLGYTNDAKWKNEKVKIVYNLGFRSDDKKKLVGKLLPLIVNIDVDKNLFTKLLTQWFSEKFNKKVSRTFIGDGHRLVSRKQQQSGFIAPSMDSKFDSKKHLIEKYLDQKFSNLNFSRKTNNDIWSDNNKNVIMMMPIENQRGINRVSIDSNIIQSFLSMFNLDFYQGQRFFKEYIEKKFNLNDIHISAF
jgi:hypothetical protein